MNKRAKLGLFIVYAPIAVLAWPVYIFLVIAEDVDVVKRVSAYQSPPFECIVLVAIGIFLNLFWWVALVAACRMFV